MNLSEINWNIEASGTWPAPVKASVIAIICLFLAGAWFYFDTLGQLNTLEAAQKMEIDFKRDFEKKQSQAVNLQDYEYQLTQIEAELYEMIRQMPTKEEVANLLIDISQMGLANGLEFKLFKLLPAVPKDFYSELPINIEVTGRYDSLGSFISGLAALPRIVTVHDVTIVPAEIKGKGNQSTKTDNLVMTATIKTYNESHEVSPTQKTIVKNAPASRGKK